MGKRSRIGVIAAVTVLFLIPPAVKSQVKTGFNPSLEETRDPSGVLTHPASKTHLATWGRIVRIVQARDKEGRIRHPELYGLWNWAETSNTPIRVVFADRQAGCAHCGGRFVIHDGSEGRGRTAAIILYTAAIDRSVVPLAPGKARRFTPFAGLSRIERYAEVLGHELAHAQWFLSNEARCRLYFELKSEAIDFQVLLRQIGYGRSGEAEPRRRAGRLGALLQEIEAPARAAEERVWRELVDKR